MSDAFKRMKTARPSMKASSLPSRASSPSKKKKLAVGNEPPSAAGRRPRREQGESDRPSKRNKVDVRVRRSSDEESKRSFSHKAKKNQRNEQLKKVVVGIRDNKKVHRPRQSWQQTYTELAAYVKQHGHCNPTRDGTADDSFLAQWMEKQRRNRQTSLSAQQIRQLDEIGFPWKSRAGRQEDNWNNHLQQLKRYKREHGNTRVPSSDKQWEQLSRWVCKQRSLHNKNQLRPDRREKLEAIGFVFSLQKNRERSVRNDNQRWGDMYNRLVEFHAQNGHCIVPRSFGAAEETPSTDNEHSPWLGGWVANQRQDFRRGNMRPDRQKLLEKLGFVWKVDLYNPKASLHQKHFDAMIERLLQFKREHGHVQVPFRYKKDYELAQWVGVQRRFFHTGELKASRKKRLDEIGFWWGKDPVNNP